MKDFFTGTYISSKSHTLYTNLCWEKGILKYDKVYTLLNYLRMPIIATGTMDDIMKNIPSAANNMGTTIICEISNNRYAYCFYTHYCQHTRDMFYFPPGMPMAFLNKDSYKECLTINNLLKARYNNNGNYDANITDDTKKSYGLDRTHAILTEGIKYTFGVEIETSGGYMPEWIWNINDAINCVHDGSITGKEYTIGPLSCDQGFMKLQEIISQIAGRCRINKKCSIHVHIGGFEMSKVNLIAIYLLGLSIQSELYKIVPPTRKESDFCRAIPSMSSKNVSTMDYDILIKYLYDYIFTSYYGGEAPSKDANKNKSHKHGPKCGYNHNSARYCWLNLVPAITKCHNLDKFEIGIHTIEIRFHEASLNYENIKNWIMMWLGIVKYAIDNSNKIIMAYKNDKKFNVSIHEILKYSYPKTFQYLLRYVNHRKLKYGMDNNESLLFEQASYIKKKPENIIPITQIIRNHRCVR